MAKEPSERNIAAGLLEFITEFIKQYYILPLLALAVTGVSAYLEDAPWWFIVPAASFSFACIATALARIAEWDRATNAKHKVVLANLDITQDPVASLFCITTTLFNLAPFEIHYQVSDLRISINQKIPAKAEAVRNLALQPSSGGTFTSEGVPITEQEYLGNEMVGKIEALITYGKPGKLKYKLYIDHTVRMLIDANRNVAYRSSQVNIK